MGLGTIFADVSEKAKELISLCAEFIKPHFKIVLIAAGALLLIIVLLLVLTVAGRGKTVKTTDIELSATTVDPLPRESFPGDNFFLPYEPDFVPDVLLERDPRDGWTEEDARPFWTDPLDGNEDVWRKRIESGIDSLLENVP